ncbi:hypothetical protein [Ekhidna sp.]|uniref:hypothetical protein n=1 Tax=Ekhidna sp. TaxID=2608089 RepID=UPI003C7C8A37
MKKLFLLFLITGSILQSLSAHPAYGIVVDKYRNIYFADIHHNGRGSIWKLHSYGKLELLLEDFHAHNVAIDDEGNIYTAHGEGNHIMVRISRNGIDTLHQSWDHHDFFGGNCTYSKGVIYFGNNHYIWQIKDGEKRKFSSHYLEWNQSIYADPDGVIYVTDKATKGGSIVRIDQNGGSKVIATNLITKLDDRPVDRYNDVILGMTKGCDGSIYAAETAGRRIARINEDGSNETFYQLRDGWTPVGVDFFSGDAYVLEYHLDENKGPRITRIRENLSKEVIFQYKS